MPIVHDTTGPNRVTHHFEGTKIAEASEGHVYAAVWDLGGGVFLIEHTDKQGTGKDWFKSITRNWLNESLRDLPRELAADLRRQLEQA